MGRMRNTFCDVVQFDLCHHLTTFEFDISARKFKSINHGFNDLKFTLLISFFLFEVKTFLVAMTILKMMFGDDIIMIV